MYMATNSTGRFIRFKTEELETFEKRFPWHGSLTQFLNQCLADFNEQYKDVPTPSAVATKAVANVIGRSY